jgi:predicted RNase H-like nuclease (RuvC/YqgF family)
MSNIDNYIDNRSYEELVEASSPTGAYDNIVSTIRYDRNRNSRYSESKLYQGKFEFYEVEGTILRNNFENSKKDLSDIKIKIDQSRDNLDELNEKVAKLKSKSSLTESEKKEIKILTTKISNLEEFISNSIDVIPYLESIIEVNKDKLEKFQWKEYIARSEYYGIRRAHEEYFKTNDLEYLRKAVHMTCSYFDKLRYGSKYIAPYKGHLLNESESPFSPEQTYRMNYSAEHTNWFDDKW